MPDRMVGVFQKLLISWDFYTQQSLEFTQNGAKNKKPPSEQHLGRQKCCDERDPRRTVRWV